MLWDASQAYGTPSILLYQNLKTLKLETANGRYDEGIKNALVADGGTGFTSPPCSAPAYVAGTDYAGGSQVTYEG